MAEASTRRGRDTKGRVVETAAALMHERGASAVSIEDILRASGTGKGQFYHYFASRDELVAEVLRHQLDRVLDDQRLFELDTLSGVHDWLDALVRVQEVRGEFRGCPLGSIATEVADRGEHLRRCAADAFVRWEYSLEAGLRTMRANGLLRADADPDALAEATIAIVQGGYLLSAIKQTSRPMRHAVDAATRHLDSFTSA